MVNPIVVAEGTPEADWRAAIAAFPSQIAPLGPAPDDAAILPPHVLARFTRPFEMLFA